MTKKKVFVEKLNRRVRVINQDLRSKYGTDSVAEFVMECLEDKVSRPLYDLLKLQLLGYNDDMQLEIADSLLDFVCDEVVHSTGCPSADATLEACYTWIAAEKGMLTDESMYELMHSY